MSSLKKAYRIFCLDESIWKRVLDTSLPTVCPTDGGHAVQAGSAHILEDVASEYSPDLYVDFETDGHLKRDTGSDIHRFMPNHENVISVSKDGRGDYTTIAAAVAAHTSPGTVYRVYPGTYVESNPITVPTMCSLIAESGPENTVVLAANTDTCIFNIGLTSRIQGFAIMGASNTNGRGVMFDGTGTPGQISTLFECIIRNCTVGVEIFNGAPNALSMFRVQAVSAGVQLQCGVDIHDQGRAIGSQLLVSGYPGLPFAEGVRVRDAGSQITMAACIVNYSNHGVSIDDDAEVRINQVLLENNTHAINVGASSDLNMLHAVGLIVRDSVTSDLQIEASDAQVTVIGSQMARDKILNPNKISLNSDFSTHANEKQFRTMTGDIRVGTVENSSKLVCGHGKQFYETMVVLSNDNLEAGTWTNNTVEATSASASTFTMFSTIATGASFYVGADVIFCGMKIKVNTSFTITNPLTDLVWEYWNGSTWIQFGTMVTDSTEPFYSHGNQFGVAVGNMHTRFGFSSAVGLVKKTLDDNEKYWIRGRITNAAGITGNPVIEQVQLHTAGTTELDKNGHIEHTGDSRTWVQLPWDIDSTKPFEDSPGNQDLYVSSTIGVGRTENQFQNSITDKVGMVFFVPENMDVSFPLKVKIAFVGSSATAGDMKFVVRRVVSHPGDSVYTSAQSTASGESSQTIIYSVGSNVQNTLLVYEFSLDIQDLYPRPQSNNHELVWITFERQGGATEDTYGGSMYMLQLSAWYVAWAAGGYLTLH